jgi:hypothetical protein
LEHYKGLFRLALDAGRVAVENDDRQGYEECKALALKAYNVVRSIMMAPYN